MFLIKRKPKTDAPPSSTGGWIVTFSDCMTLLLCFFVMLVSFSSFDEASLEKISGAVKNRSYSWIFPIRSDIKDSVFPDMDRPIDWTAEGSEMPTQTEPTLVKYPKPPAEIPETDAYRASKEFYIPAEKLFFGKGAVLRPAGRRYLGMIASFMRLVPCRVVVSACNGDTEQRGRERVALERAWTVMDYFTSVEGLPSDRFNIAAGQALPKGHLRRISVVKIALLAWSVYQ